ncbi:hypothetical protein [Ramlibacter rhizophilus]|uniref:Uncharacterized protein n=1 Tax=Ramlibacter rhizophilus TaxID=1781167 RepID=A0A4Z0BQD2_9BURK|nr:hypothetical protein [Ramlibacter rhizophilus]TFZ01503.1 hypothetical protein EZ242_09020 [Ramlibacter rhizophilus]
MQHSTLDNLKVQAQDLKHRVQAWDASRDGLPAEHWMALAGGLVLFMATRRASIPVKLAGSILASMLVVRAATGRHGLQEKRWLPL